MQGDSRKTIFFLGRFLEVCSSCGKPPSKARLFNSEMNKYKSALSASFCFIVGSNDFDVISLSFLSLNKENEPKKKALVPFSKKHEIDHVFLEEWTLGANGIHFAVGGHVTGSVVQVLRIQALR